MKKLYSLLVFIFLLLTISCDEEAALAAVECEQDFDCAGDCGGTAVIGGCDETCGSTLENDDCGVCGGDSTTCSPVTFNFTGNVDTFDADSFETSLASTLSCDVSQVEVVDYGYVSSNNRDEEMYVIVNFLESDSSETSIDDLLQTVQTEFANGGSVGNYNVSAPIISNISEDACQSALDDCGICGGSGIPEGECDCFGNVNDCNGECGGAAIEDCNGDCGGSAIVDACGDCGGDAESLDDCPVCYNGSINPGLIGFWDGVNYSEVGSDCGPYAIQYPSEYRLEFNELEDGSIHYSMFYGNSEKELLINDGCIVNCGYEDGGVSCLDELPDPIPGFIFPPEGANYEEYLVFGIMSMDQYIAGVDLDDGVLTMEWVPVLGIDCLGTLTFNKSPERMCDDDMIDQEILGDWLGSSYSASSGCNPDDTMTQDEIMEWWLQVEYNDENYTFDAEQNEYDCSEDSIDGEDTCTDSQEGVFSCSEIGNDVQMCFEEEEQYIDGYYDSHLTDCQNVSLSVDLTTLTISSTNISFAENDLDYDFCTETFTFVRPYTLDCISDCDATQIITFQSFMEDFDEDEISDEEAYSFCNWFSSQDDNGCLTDCGVNNYLDEIMDLCEEIIEDNDSDSDGEGSDESGDGNDPFSCLSDCEDLDIITGDPADIGQTTYCNTLLSVDQNCWSDCSSDVLSFMDIFIMQCETCIEANACECCFVDEEPDGCGGFECATDSDNNSDNGNECDDEDDSCLDDCNLEGLEGNITEDPNAFCQIAVDVDLSCVEDCNGCDEGLSDLVAMCIECLAANDCNDVFADADEESENETIVIIDDCLEFFNADEVDACTTFTDELTCDQSDACDWDSDTNSCSSEGPPTCIWDCDGLCDWVSINSDVNLIDQDPIGFCSWLVDTLPNAECSSDCDDTFTNELDGYVIECQACLNTNDPLSDECLAIDGDDSDDSESSTSESCNADLAGTWTLALSGYISDDTGDCTGTQYPTTPDATNTQLTLSSDCAYTVSSDIQPCNGSSSDESFCSGSWSSSEATLTVIPAYATSLISFVGTSAFEYQLNEGNTTATQLLQADTSGDDDDATFNTCLYIQYTKD